MELYIIRHGETVWNKAGKIQGYSDIPLNENGRSLAATTGKALENVHFDRIFSSPLVRAYETAQLIRGKRNIAIEKQEELKEIGFGIMEGSLYKEEMCNTESPIYKFFKHPEEYAPPQGGETIEHLCKRAADFLENKIFPLEKSCERVLIVAHGAMNKAILTYVKKLEKKDFWSGTFQKNCAVTVIEIKDAKMRILEEGKVLA